MMAERALRPLDGALPQNIEAEQALLGSCLIDKRGMDRLTWLESEDFYLPVDAEIFRAMRMVVSQGCATDVVTVADFLRCQNRLDAVGGPAYLASLASLVPTSVNIEYYGRIVWRLAHLRRLIDAGNQIAAIGYDETHQDPMIAHAEAVNILDTVQNSIPYHDESFGEAVDRIIRRILDPEAEVERIPTGLADVDAIITGIRRGELVILAGLSSSGKTSLAATMCWDVGVRRGGGSIFFSSEVMRDQVIEKLVCFQSGIPFERLEVGELSDTDCRKLHLAKGVLREALIEVVDSIGMTMSRIRATARKLSIRLMPALVVIDYLQLLEWEDRRGVQAHELGRLVLGAKAMAKELDCAVILLSQFNREATHGEEPKISQLLGSSMIENTADLVVMLTNPSEFNPYSPRPVEPKLVTIAKNRNGPRGRATAGFRSQHMQFVDYREQHAPTFPRTGF